MYVLTYLYEVGTQSSISVWGAGRRGLAGRAYIHASSLSNPRMDQTGSWGT